MDVDIRKNNKDCEYLLIDKSDKYDVNKLQGIRNIDSIYLKNNETGVLTKISEQNLKQYFSSNKEELKTIINEVIDINRNISKEESERFLSNLFNEKMNEILAKTSKGCSGYCFLKFNSIVSELPENAKNGEIFGLFEEENKISYYLFLNDHYLNLIDKDYFDSVYYNRQKVNAKLEELSNKIDELINTTENTINSTILVDEYDSSLNKIHELQNEINLIKDFLNIRQYLNI